MARWNLNAEQRFWTKVEVRGPDDCWPWLAYLEDGGYGQFWDGEKHVQAQTYGWILKNGPLPDGKPCGCHSCDVRYPVGSIEYRKCCNPAHVFPGTIEANIADMVAKGRQAVGARHGSVTVPGRLARGDRNGSRTHPERLPRGEANVMAKLRAADIPKIRALIATGKRQKDIAAEFGVSDSTIYMIDRRKCWAHVP